MRSQIVEFHFCPYCTALIRGKAGRCARCRRGAASSTPLQKRLGSLKGAMSRLRQRRYARKDIPVGLCPNCQGVMPQDAGRCSRCKWENSDAGGERSPAKPRRLAQRFRAAFGYKKKAYCTFCGCAVRTSAAFCPLCMTPFHPDALRPSLPALVGTQLRRRRAQKGVERAALCPTCDIYVPDWADTCYCCGWVCPPRTDLRAVFGVVVESTKQRAALIGRRQGEDGDLCPTCDVCVPRSDRMCMICGWKPARNHWFQDDLHALRTERARLASRARQKRMRLCEHCDLPLLPGYMLCMVCGWTPDPTPLQRITSVEPRRRKATVRDDQDSQCPNCRISLAENARHCSACGWSNGAVHSRARQPQMIWLVPICLVLFSSLMATLLQMADPANAHGHIDRYGRNGSQNHRWDMVLTSPTGEP